MSSRKAPERRSRLAEKAAQTRERLLEVALELLASREFRTMSLDAIAARAGVTKGAIYGHFDTKNDLLAAALFSRPEARPEAMDWPQGHEGSVRDRLRRLAKVVLSRRREARRAAAIGAEFIVYALSEERMSEEVGERMNAAHAEMEEKVRGMFRPEELPMPVASFTLLMSALIPGLMFARAFRGEAMTDRQVIELFEGLAGQR